MLHRRATGDKDRVGYLFARAKGRKASLGDYDPLFRDYLKREKRRGPSYLRLESQSKILVYGGH